MFHPIHAPKESRHARRAGASEYQGSLRALRSISYLTAALILGTVQLGCGKAPESAVRPAVALTTATSIENRISITGKVLLNGGRPSTLDQVIDVGANVYCSSHGKITDPTWQISADGGLAGVVISVKDSGRASNVDAAPVLIDQVSCLYQPHITVLQPGQTVLIRNSDETFHNVRIIRHDRTLKTQGENLSNLGQPSRGSADMQAFNEPAIFRLECDVHRWMKSWVYVHTGIHVATSRSDGTFAIDRALPDGTYVVEAWHPCFANALTRTVRVVGGVANADFQFNLAEANQH
jgi:plastocyanin